MLPAVAPHPSAPAPSETLPVGTELFGYRLDGVLGAGGMGTVYKAVQLSLQRPVALKVLGGRFARTPALAEDFLKEARATAKVSHQNLVMVHDVHADPGRRLYAYAMEYVPGSTLTGMVAHQGPLKRTSALHIAYQIAKALAAAHKAGLVHRDVKPDNILITGNGLAKLLDLGLVRDRLEGQVVKRTDHHMLRIVGTPDWAAPEQIRNPDHACPASDIFGLGATLFYALTGEQPFAGETAIDLIVNVCTGPVEYPASVPRDCQLLLDLMLAKDPADRIPDGGELVRILDGMANGQLPALEGRPTTARVAKPGTGRIASGTRKLRLRRLRYRRR